MNMKTNFLKLSVMATIFTCLFVLNSNASNADKSKKVSKETKALKALTNSIDSKISFPSFALENNENGYVSVEIEIAENGSLNVEQIIASNPEFEKYVLTQLSTVTIDSNNPIIGKKVVYKFKFIAK